VWVVIRVTHFSDPGCPWAYSAGPAFAALHWRYGAQLEWRHVMIGLSETREQYLRRGMTGESQARNYRSFRSRGMPFATEPRERPHATWPMCRVVVATRRLAPEREWTVFRALQLAQFTSTLTLDEPAGIERALGWVPGIDAAALVAASTEPETEELFAADRALARSAGGGPTEFQGRSATTPEGEVRFTAPSLVFTATDGRSLEVGGFQPLEAYDVAIANLDRSLERRPAAEGAAEVIAAFPDGLTTSEVAAVMAQHLRDPDRDAAEDGLISAVAAGAARRRPFGNDALWTPASVVTSALAA
jgi:2-hydroxychromene-2-carboxylate isomerase